MMKFNFTLNFIADKIDERFVFETFLERSYV